MNEKSALVGPPAWVPEAVKSSIVTDPPLKLDFGCGPHPRDGFAGVDQYPFDGKVKYVVDIRKTPWPWADSSVDEANASHFLEHLTVTERCSFLNELHRVLKPNANFAFAVPHWNSNRAYGDPTHQWPPISEMFFFYLNREWRMANAPHTDKSVWSLGYSCNFDFTYGYTLRPDILERNQDYQQYAMRNLKEVCMDTVGNLMCRK